jgi:hypothetical protein
MSEGPFSDDHYIPAIPTIVLVEPQITRRFNQSHTFLFGTSVAQYQRREDKAHEYCSTGSRFRKTR